MNTQNKDQNAVVLTLYYRRKSGTKQVHFRTFFFISFSHKNDGKIIMDTAKNIV